MTACRLALSIVAALALGACSDSTEPSYQGWVEADLIFVSPDETGRIETLEVREGVPVQRGSPLFTVDSELQLSDVAMAQAQVTNARTAFERAQALLRTAAGTQRTYDDAEAALRTAEARLNSAQTRLTRRSMVSPVAGNVQQIYYRPGELVPAGRPVLSLLPPGNIKVRFFVPEAVLPTIALGETVKINCDGCRNDLTARISFISRSSEFTPPVIYSQDERSKLVFMIEARTETPENLRVGQPVSIFPVEKKP